MHEYPNNMPNGKESYKEGCYGGLAGPIKNGLRTLIYPNIQQTENFGDQVTGPRGRGTIPDKGTSNSKPEIFEKQFPFWLVNARCSEQRSPDKTEGQSLINLFFFFYK